MTVHCDKISYNKTNYIHLFLKFILGIKLYMFRTVPQFIISSFSLNTQQWGMSYNFGDSLRAGLGSVSILILLASCQPDLYDIYHCCVCSKKLLMMDRETVRNM
jgi:hypothetical protein